MVVVLAALLATATWIDEPLRRSIERNLGRIAGHTFRIEKLHVRPLGLSVELEGVTAIQNDHPEPPVLHVDSWTASLHWRELLSGKLVNDQVLRKPAVHVTRRQAREEVKQGTPWQEALEAIYPFKINQLRVIDADITYVEEQDPSRPLQVQHLYFEARNIRNIRSREHVYPSTLHLEAVVFGGGRLELNGRANFLATPHPGVEAAIAVEDVELARLLPVTGRVNLQLRQGVLTAAGQMEYAPHVKSAELNKFDLRDARLDYVHSSRTKEAEKARAKKTVEAAKEVMKEPTLYVRIKEGTISRSEFGFVDESTDPKYRVFLTDAEVSLKNFSNELKDGTARIDVKGKFMGSGRTEAVGVFRPERPNPDFDLTVKLDGTPVKSLNDLLRTYGKFDVASGMLSVYSELTVQNGAIRGYVKPLFKDVEVYDAHQDREKSIVRKLYERVVGGIGKLLESPPRRQVATKAEVEGPAGNPRTNTWQAVVMLIQNAFFEEILPGLDREIHRKS